MTIQDLGAIGEFVGAIAVVASLVYLAAQIRQNTQQIFRSIESEKHAAFERNIESANRVRELLMLNPDLADLYRRGLKNFLDLDDAEQFRFGLLMRNTFAEFQAAYLRHLAIGGEHEEFAGAAGLIDAFLRHAGVREWLDKSKVDWRPEFHRVVEERLAAVESEIDPAN